MALIDTSIVSAPGGSLVPSTSGLSQLIGNALAGKAKLDREDARLKQVEEAKTAQEQAKTTQAQLFRIREIKDPVTQRMEIARLGLSENEAGRSGGKFIEILNATTPDDLNLAITREATALGNADELLDMFTKGATGTGGLASAKTEILESGATVQVVPAAKGQVGDVIVTNPAGKVVTGDERIQVLRDSRQQALRTLSDEEKVKTKAAGETEAVKLKTQFKLKPPVDQAVAETLASVKESTKLKTETRSNDKAFKIYNTAMSTLTSALSETTTGPFVGLLPALTDNQQIVDGATAAMAPVLKTLFRESGEGTFTKDDQEILLDMLPKRTDRPATQRSKLQNIDAIVRIKLGQQVDSGSGDTQPNISNVTPQDIDNMTPEQLQALDAQLKAQGL